MTHQHAPQAFTPPKYAAHLYHTAVQDIIEACHANPNNPLSEDILQILSNRGFTT